MILHQPVPKDDQRTGMMPINNQPHPADGTLGAARNVLDRDAFLPSAKHIARETAKLRAGWTEEQHHARAGLPLTPWTAPELEGGVL